MLKEFFFCLIFLLGVCVGSFLNCVVYRLKEGKGFLSGRSFCPKCKHKLSWQDLIPILSFFLLKGRCRYCKEKISWQYPLVEIATGTLFLLIFNFQFPIFNEFLMFKLQNLLIFSYQLLITCFLIIIFIYDLKYFIIPDRIIYPAMGITFLYRLFEIWNFGYGDLSEISDLALGVLPSLFFLFIILLSRGRWMGIGDFKLAMLMGFFLGFTKTLVALFLSFFIGSIIGTELIIFGKKSLKSEIPFGPFLVTGTFLAWFWGEQIIDWYFTFFNLI